MDIETIEAATDKGTQVMVGVDPGGKDETVVTVVDIDVKTRKITFAPMGDAEAAMRAGFIEWPMFNFRPRAKRYRRFVMERLAERAIHPAPRSTPKRFAICAHCGKHLETAHFFEGQKFVACPTSEHGYAQVKW